MRNHDLKITPTEIAVQNKYSNNVISVCDPKQTEMKKIANIVLGATNLIRKQV